MLKNYGLLILVVAILVSCQKKSLPDIPFLELQKQAEIDSLGQRYLDLNRFSGKILISKDGLLIYKQSFGLSNYNQNEKFSDSTMFNISGFQDLIISKPKDSIPNAREPAIDLETLELDNTSFSRPNFNAATGYLYDNPDGKGLQLRAAPKAQNKVESDGQELWSSAFDVLKIVEAYPQSIATSGYTENDGFSYGISKDRESDLIVIILSNRRHPVANEMLQSINAILESGSYDLPLLRTPVTIDESTLRDFTGTYAINKNMSFYVFQKYDSLFVKMGPQQIYLVPQSNNQFFMKEQDAAMRFIKDSTNTVNRVELLNGFINSNQFAERID